MTSSRSGDPRSATSTRSASSSGSPRWIITFFKCNTHCLIALRNVGPADFVADGLEYPRHDLGSGKAAHRADALDLFNRCRRTLVEPDRSGFRPFLNMSQKS